MLGEFKYGMIKVRHSDGQLTPLSYGKHHGRILRPTPTLEEKPEPWSNGSKGSSLASPRCVFGDSSDVV